MSDLLEDKFLQMDSRYYSRIGADSITLGSYGRSSSFVDAIFSVQQLEPHGRINLPIELIYLDSKKLSQKTAASLGSEVRASNGRLELITIDGRVSAAKAGELSADLALGLAEISSEGMLRFLNASRETHFYEWLSSAGRSAAVVTKIYYAVDGHIEKTLESSAAIEITLDGNKIGHGKGSGKVSSDATRMVRIDLAPGSTVAYQMSNLVWDGIKVVDLEENDPVRFYTE